jgi:hypothetical protein
MSIAAMASVLVTIGVMMAAGAPGTALPHCRQRHCNGGTTPSGSSRMMISAR